MNYGQRRKKKPRFAKNRKQISPAKLFSFGSALAVMAAHAGRTSEMLAGISAAVKAYKETNFNYASARMDALKWVGIEQ